MVRFLLVILIYKALFDWLSIKVHFETIKLIKAIEDVISLALIIIIRKI